MQMNLKKWNIICAALLLTGCQRVQTVEKYDDVPPYINVSTYSFYTSIGMPIDFSNITAYDDVDGLTPVSVVGTIDYDKPGEYTPSLYAVDTQGNASSVEIYVYVFEEEQVAVSVEDETETEIVLEEEVGCKVYGALDPELPCNRVLADTVEDYETLFIGQEGLLQCESRIPEEGGYACDVITSNDGNFWGYGIRVEEIINEEE